MHYNNLGYTDLDESILKKKQKSIPCNKTTKCWIIVSTLCIALVIASVPLYFTKHLQFVSNNNVHSSNDKIESLQNELNNANYKLELNKEQRMQQIKEALRKEKESNNAICTTKSCIEIANNLLQWMDFDVDPCDDFYQYTCGGFMDDYEYKLYDKNVEGYGTFNILDENEHQIFLSALVEESKSDDENSLFFSKAFEYYKSCYNDPNQFVPRSIEDVYKQPNVKHLLFEDITFSNDTYNKIQWTNVHRYHSVLSFLTARQWNPFWTISINDEYQFIIAPNPYPWLNSDDGICINPPKTLTKDEKSLLNSLCDLYIAFYKNFVERGLQKEEKIIKKSDKMIDDINSFLEGNALLNYGIILNEYLDFSQINNNNFTIIKIGENTIFKEIAYLSLNFKPSTVQDIIFNAAFPIPTNNDKKHQKIYTSRNEFCLSNTIELFPYVYGYIMSEHLYSNDKYNKITEMVKNIKNNGIRSHILNNAAKNWLDTESLNNTIKKLNNIKLFIGTPPELMNKETINKIYSIIKLDQLNSHCYSLNWYRMKSYQYEIDIQLFHGGENNPFKGWPSEFIDRSSYNAWLTGINAFYQPSGNFFTIPIPISQQLFYDVNYPLSLNYGGLGSVIGHEISHGFDPQGSHFDYNGNYNDIWTNYTRNKYNQITQCFIDEYSQLSPPNTHEKVNGKQTITENVADNGGIVASYTAWIDEHKKKVKANNNIDFKENKLPGLADITDEQLFFIGFAHLWCTAYNPNLFVNWTDVHSPMPVRVQGTIQNNPHFAKAFNCKANSKMNPDKKCILW